MLLSVAMIVKNEEKNLDRCLSAIKILEGKIKYEIIIVDTGSNDNTIEIAKKYTDKIYEYKWNGNFADMRNISIKHCTGKWILVLDADEVLENHGELVKFLKDKEAESFSCAVVKLKNMISADEDNYIIGSLVRLFKNNKNTYYKGRIHEQPNIISPVLNTNITFTHYGYSREDFKVMKYKYERNKELLLKDLEEGKDRIYTLFQLAQTYSMANQKIEALNAIEKAFRIVEEEANVKKYLYIYHFYARELLAQNSFEKSIIVCEDAIKVSKEHLDFYYLLARSYKMLDKNREAEVYFEEYFKLYQKIEDGNVIVDVSIANFSFSKRNEMVKERLLNSYKRKKYSEVKEYFNQVNNENYKNELKEIYMYSLIKLKQFDGLKYFLKDENLDDKEIQSLVNIIETVQREECEAVFNKELEELIVIDKRLEKYIQTVYLNKNIRFSELVYDGFYAWKATVLQKEINQGLNFENIMITLKVQDLYQYINSIINDYDCLNKLYEYSNENILSSNFKVLRLLNCIEEVLLTNNSINNEEYEDLIYRAYINKKNYIKKIYNDDILESEHIRKVLSKYELFWMDIQYVLNIYQEDRVKFIRELKKILKEVPEYKRVIEYFLNEVSEIPISEEMKMEKKNLLDIVEGLVSESKVNDAKELLNELNKTFKFDSNILNSLGVVEYLSEDYNNAIKLLALADSLGDDFNVKYNLASILKVLNRQESTKYFKEAYSICNNDELKEEIMSMIN